MIDAGYDEAIGAMTYIDGRYVKPQLSRKTPLAKSKPFLSVVRTLWFKVCFLLN